MRLLTLKINLKLLRLVIAIFLSLMNRLIIATPKKLLLLPMLPAD